MVYYVYQIKRGNTMLELGKGAMITVELTDREIEIYGNAFNGWTYACDLCGKMASDPEGIGWGGGELCESCWDAEGVENAHYDGYHVEAKVEECPLC